MKVNPAHFDSITKLYQDHHSWLHSWLRRKIKCSHQAADLTHDTFMRLLVREEPIFIQEPRAFLTTVAQRVLANHWRRKQIEQAYFEMLAQHPEASVLSPEECAILLETLLEIDHLLDGCSGQVISDTTIGFFTMACNSYSTGVVYPRVECNRTLL